MPYTSDSQEFISIFFSEEEIIKEKYIEFKCTAF